MNKLFIDTSAGTLGLAIKQDDKVLSCQAVELKKQIAEDIIPLVKKMAEDNGLKFSSFDEIFVTSGPGSYTGERIGLTVAKVYCVINKKTKAYLISTLKAMSLEELDKTTVSLIDARNDAYFMGIYAQGHLIGKEKRAEQKEAEILIKENNADVILLSDQYDLLESRFSSSHVIKTAIIKNMTSHEDAFVLVDNPLAIKPVYLSGKNE